MNTQSPWTIEQTKRDIAPIEQTYLAQKPNGEVTEVNRFDFNLAHFAGTTDRNIQCSDLSWIRISNLKLLSEDEQQVFIAATPSEEVENV